MIRAMDIWLPAFLRQKAACYPEGAHLVLSVCDHFEPFHDTDKAGAVAAMDDWTRLWPLIAGGFRDSGGNGVKHTFFYPIEQYDADIVECVAVLCRKTGAETEVHLHHHDDTAENLRSVLKVGVQQLMEHGLLCRDSSQRPRFGFIHGNWALDNSDPNGCNCGVDDELGVLREAGCYADFTMPSAPHRAQTRTVNSIYYARDTNARKSHDSGKSVQTRKTSSLRDAMDHLLMVQGPLALNWKKRKWGVMPKVENGEISGANPPTALRLELWERYCPKVEGGPAWIFVKLHTHGGIARNYNTLLGSPMKRFHEYLQHWMKGGGGAGMRLHYATAREMVNMIHAAEDGCSGNPEEYRNYLYQAIS